MCLPKDLAGKVIALIPSQVDADEWIAEDIMQGKTFQEASKEHRAGVKKVEDL